MALVSGTDTVGKTKALRVVLSGFASAAGATSNFGAGSDINCTDVEYFSLSKPEKSENESVEIQTNLRSFKDDVANKFWDSWSGLEVYNDSKNTNWKAFVAAQETDATGTVTISVLSSTGTATVATPIGCWKAKVSKAGGGGGDAPSFDTSFTPTFTLIESLELPTASTSVAGA